MIFRIIMHKADTDIEMVKDPFLEAGIDIPEELPYQESRKSTIISSVFFGRYSTWKD